MLGNWLYGTAQRAARTLKTRAARRLKHEAREATMASSQPSNDANDPAQNAARLEEVRIVHEEIARLPGACRTPVVLCDLEGRNQEEVAQLLHCSDRTLRRRLDHARHLLRLRLIRRGLAPTAGLVAAALGPDSASAAIPQITVDTTAQAAIRFAAGQATAGIVPASATALAEGVITAMFWTKLKAITIVSAAIIIAGIGVGAGASVSLQAAPRTVKHSPKRSRRPANEPRPICGRPRNNTGRW